MTSLAPIPHPSLPWCILCRKPVEKLTVTAEEGMVKTPGGVPVRAKTGRFIIIEYCHGTSWGYKNRWPPKAPGGG
jgi:hypothetical protein